MQFKSTINNFIYFIKNQKIHAFIIFFVVFLFSFMLVLEKGELFNTKTKYSIEQAYKYSKQNSRLEKPLAAYSKMNKVIYIFYQPGCSACKREKDFVNNVLKNKYSEVKFQYYSINKPEKMRLMKIYSQEYGIDESELGVPAVFIGNDYIIGFEQADKEKFEAFIDKNFFNKNTGSSIKQNSKNIELTNENQKQYVNTWFGKIDLFNTSLPLLAVSLGLVDGFNPCAMWVLVYMISLVASLSDKRKIWLIVGSFVLASGVLYFLFMTALLQVFLYIGYLRILELVVGCAALYIGLMDLKSYFIDKGHVFCKVDNPESKSKTRGRINDIVNAEISILTILAIIGLAFVVNSMEFVCSAALPAIYVNILTKADLSLVTYYFYILLYVIFFMLDDLVIFGTAAFAINKFAGDDYLKYSKLIGGFILLLLGCALVFLPDYLA